MKERRRELRVIEENKVLLTMPEGSGSPGAGTVSYCFTRDISAGGVQILTGVKLEPGRRVKLEISLSGSRKSIRAAGEVRWVREVYEGEVFEAGLEFVSLHPDAEIALIDHVYGKKRGRRKGRKTGRLTALVAMLSVLSFGCGTPSEETQVKDLIREAAHLAEKRDSVSLMDLLARDYSDFQGRDKAATRLMIDEYLRSFRGVVIHVLGAEVVIEEPGRLATVTADMTLSSGAAEAFRKIVRFTGDLYRFDLEVAKDPPEGWKIIYADWRAISLPDLFPESLESLKKIFPGS